MWKRFRSSKKASNRDLDNFWPQLWLPGEPELSTARILTFGYNAHFSSKKERASLTIGDFASDLLFRMKYCENGPERLGQVPLIVVAHSMGGLVFKKAFIHGHMNDEFRGIVSSIKAVLFLATPHRGTDLAETLNKILTSSVFGHSPKDYVSELASRSPTIDELNESFRYHASKLQIFSFYETLRALRSVVSTATSPKQSYRRFEEDLSHIAAFLGVSGPPEEELVTARAVRKAGTCQHFLMSQEFNDLVSTRLCPVLWVHASPGSGKSVLCASVIDHLLEQNRHCVYFFFKHGDHQKRSLANMLRSLAYQMALQVPAYRRELTGMAKSGLQMHGLDALSIWKRLYLSLLSEIKLEEEIYWVIDGLDESESSKQVVDFISAVGDFKDQIRVLVFSRPLPVINQSFHKARKRTPIAEKSLENNEEDIRLFVTDEIDYLPSDDDFKSETTNEIIRRSQGNFLWVSLVLKRVVRCHRQEQVQQVLETTPDGMNQLYGRMLSVVADLEMPEDKRLARILLSWAMYAKNPVTVEELSEFHATEIRAVMDLKHTSAREYLRKSKIQSFPLDSETVHEVLFYKCLVALCDRTLRVKMNTLKIPQFLSTSITLSVSGLSNIEWDDGLARVSASSGRALRLAVSSLYLAVAADRPKGHITLWDTNLFEEKKVLSIGEHIDSLVFNESRSLLACCGLTRTHVWKLGNWSLVREAANPHRERAIEFKFDEGGSLLMVTDLRRVYRLSTNEDAAEPPSWMRLDPTLLEEANVPEVMFLGTPSSVAFNTDCTQVAVAYRAFPLSIWTLDPPEMVSRLKLKPKPRQRAANSHTGTNKVVWHPSGTCVLGIYGQVFKWSPIDDTYDEVKGETGVIPHEIQCSPNGLVFITSDVEGTIKIYDVGQMTAIYKLTSEDTINRICFSSDSLRFYDLRGSYCNVWEPNCLLRLADAFSERFNDTDSINESLWSDTEHMGSTSISFPISESHANSKPKITAVAAGRNPGQPLVYANSAGSIELFDPTDSSRHTITKTLFGMGAESLAWSRSHDRLVYSLLNGVVVVKSISRTAGQRQLFAETVYSEKKPPVERGRVQQLLFDSTGKLLFIYGTKSSQVLTLPDGHMTAVLETPGRESARWKQHPSRPDALIRIELDAISVFTWQLQKERSIPLDAAPGPKESPIIESILQSHHPRMLLLRTMTLELNRPRYSFSIVRTSSIYNDEPNEHPVSIKPISLPKAIAEAASYPLGILSDGRMVFLDSSLWVCTAQVADASDTITRHFFLPHDWVTTSGIMLSQLLQDGTILCPCKGEVAIIQNDMVSEW
ncbi:hypothetical protein DL769_009726 [Monosporascus sp. CRB-8-3]|nr:hypothetical protein DL769_009726 [Monosporascus sp. CRB-8-3]